MTRRIRVHGRTAALLLIVFASSPAVAESFSSSGSVCAAFLASSTAATPEEAIADAWAEIVLKGDRAALEEWTLSALSSTGAATESSLQHVLRPPSHLVDGAGQDGLSQLLEIIELLQRQGVIDPAGLASLFTERAATHAQEREHNRRATKEGTQKRRTARDFVRVVRTPVGIEHPLLRLASGRIAMAGGHKLVIVEADGSQKVKIEFPHTTVHSVVQLADGRITVSSNEGLIQSFDESGNPAGEIMLPGHRTAGLLALRDGGFVSANLWGTVSFVGADHETLFGSGDGVDGNVTGTPIQLSSNGNVVVTDHSGCVSFFNSLGELLNRTCTDFPVESGALELANGDVLAVNGRGLGSVFADDGTLRHQFSIQGAALNPVQFPSGTVAIATSQGQVHFLDSSGMPNGTVFDSRSAIISDLSVVRGNTLAFSSEDGNLHLLDEDGTEIYKLHRSDTIRAPLMDGDNGTLIAGTAQGNLLFMDIDGLKSIDL